MTARYFLTKQKQKLGPFPLEHLQQLATIGTLLPSDMLLPEGENKWVPAVSVPGLFPAAIVVPAVEPVRCWVLRDGQPHGPILDVMLQQELVAGRMSADTLVCPVGAKQWQTLVVVLRSIGIMPSVHANSRPRVTLEVRDVTVDVPGKRLVDSVSLTIFPSEFVGLMGLSGSGKTTLMNALNGYTPPTKGDILLNGLSLYEYYEEFSNLLGYVPQDDIMHRDLTVGQAMYYTARLRLPSGYSRADIRQRISDVLGQLGLKGTENVLIGSPERKGISGGQRKRVNLAMELLTDPVVLFLDEPTSGLSSEDALVVMKVLRGLADAGKTILLTLHQPSLEAFRLMDNLVVVSRDKAPGASGVLVYYGPAHPDAITFFNPGSVPSTKDGAEPSPDKLFSGMTQRPASEWKKCYEATPSFHKFVMERAGNQPFNDRLLPVSLDDDWPILQTLRQLAASWTMVKRCLVIKAKDTWNTAILLAQAPIVAGLLVVVFGARCRTEVNTENGMQMAGSVGVVIFLLGLSALWFGCSNSIREIVGEWAIYRRERMVNLRIPAYVASKLTVLASFCVVQCVTLLAIVHWGCALRAGWMSLFIVLLLVATVGVALGLTLSALARTSEMAIGLLPLVLLPMVILVQVSQISARISSAPAADFSDPAR